MNNLAKHIEILLLDNDCVIVPNLGGFIAHYQPAYYQEENDTFYPPVRTIAFNSQLNINDGLLAQSYMKTFQTDFPDACTKIEADVNQLVEQLHQEGVFRIPHIGTMHYNMQQTYEFIPSEVGVFTPGLYGLGTFTMQPLDCLRQTNATTEKLVTTTPKQSQEFGKVIPAQTYTSSKEKKKKAKVIAMRTLEHVAAAAVAIIAFFLLSVPAENTYMDKGEYASLGTDGLFESLKAQSLAFNYQPVSDQQNKANKSARKPVVTKTVKIEKNNEEKVITETKKMEQVETTPSPAQPAIVEAKAPTKQYYLIVASLGTRDDAEIAVKRYAQKGYEGGMILENNGRYRIALEKYEDQAEANRRVALLRQDDRFKEAWVFSSK